MDGLLIVDKPSGPTSHDVVARMRRVLRETRIGHTGTLDPMATGVLLLVIGKATRLAKFLSASDKSYDAIVRFGFATDTADAQGRPIGPMSERRLPSRDEIEAALEPFRGTFMQQPPAFSAKKIDGQRSYKLARARRRDREVSDTVADPSQVSDTVAVSGLPPPASVTAHAIEILSVEAETVTLRVVCSAGFYVRSLAHDLGERLGVGAHLTGLRRTRTGDFGLDRAVTLDTAERDPRHATAALVPLAGMLPNLVSVSLTAEGVKRVVQGRDVGESETVNAQRSMLNGQLSGSPQPSALSHSSEPFVRLLDPRGGLVAIARRVGVGDLLHPSVVLV